LDLRPGPGREFNGAGRKAGEDGMFVHSHPIDIGQAGSQSVEMTRM
jgi:hypothetical protein